MPSIGGAILGACIFTAPIRLCAGEETLLSPLRQGAQGAEGERPPPALLLERPQEPGIPGADSPTPRRDSGMTAFAPEIETWTTNYDGTWNVVVTKGGVELKRWTDAGRLPVDLFREAQAETAAKYLKQLKRKNSRV